MYNIGIGGFLSCNPYRVLNGFFLFMILMGPSETEI